MWPIENCMQINVRMMIFHHRISSEIKYFLCAAFSAKPTCKSTETRCDYLNQMCCSWQFIYLIYKVKAYQWEVHALNEEFYPIKQNVLVDSKLKLYIYVSSLWGSEFWPRLLSPHRIRLVGFPKQNLFPELVVYVMEVISKVRLRYWWWKWW